MWGADMGDVQASELRQHLREILERVEAGERVRIRRRGRVVAELVPAGESQPRWKRPPEATVTLPPGPGIADVVVEERETAGR